MKGSADPEVPGPGDYPVVHSSSRLIPRLGRNPAKSWRWAQNLCEDNADPWVLAQDRLHQLQHGRFSVHLNFPILWLLLSASC